jgi:hypothetical protein
MGMLLQRHRRARAEAEREAETSRPAPRRRRNRRQTTPKATTPEPTSLDGSDYTSLSDEQVAEAYATTFPEGEATERDAQVVELRALNVNRDSFNADPE